MMNSLLSLNELFNFMCWMLMKVDSIMGIGKKRNHTCCCLEELFSLMLALSTQLK